MPKKKKKVVHGGKRPGAGAKPIGEESMILRSIRVQPKQWEHWQAAAKRAGVPLNQFIREAVDKAAR